MLNTPAAEGIGGLALSPDGRWLAYAANPTDRQEIWVRPYPGPGAPVRVSPNGGAEPLWAPNGRELYYREGQSVMAVTVQTGNELQFGTPVRIIESGYASAGQPPSYDVAPDGRFLLLKLGDGGSAQRPITVIVNWMEDLRRRTGQ